MKGAYYNEFDPFAAAWLRELIADGRIAPGEVDTRSFEDVSPADLAGYVQCHFFAGIGVWSLALRNAGWADERPIWTGSCPCQPFSAAGKGSGFADERHLWPAFHHLIRECRPAVVAGEQVASKDGLAWLDLVQADMEGEGYAFGAVDTCAAGFGAPHIRQRLYWMANAESARRTNGAAFDGGSRPLHAAAPEIVGVGDRSTLGRLANADGRDASSEGLQRDGQQRQQPQDRCAGDRLGEPSRQGSSLCQSPAVVGARGRQEGRATEQPSRASRGLAHSAGSGRREECADAGRLAIGDSAEGLPAGLSTSGSDQWPGPTNGLWRNVDWLGCRDGKWRPVEPGTFPLAHAGTFRNRVAELRGAGNAINLAQAQGFIEAICGALGDVGVMR